jgi:hypothetical protein
MVPALARVPSLRFLVSLSLALGGILACGGESDEKRASPAPAATPAAPAPPVPETGSPSPAEPTEPAADAGEVGLPSDVPRYPGATLGDSRGDDELGLTVTLESGDDVQTVARYYASELRKQDWAIQEAPAEEEGGLAIFADKGSRSLTVMVTPSPGGSEIGLLVLEMQ